MRLPKNQIIRIVIRSFLTERKEATLNQITDHINRSQRINRGATRNEVRNVLNSNSGSNGDRSFKRMENNKWKLLK